MHENANLPVSLRRLLEVLLKHCPGMAEAHLLLAESHHLAGDSPVALRKVADVLHRAPDMLPAHLLLTRIYLHQVSVHMSTYVPNPTDPTHVSPPGCGSPVVQTLPLYMFQ